MVLELLDQHGTSGLYLDSTAQTPTWRQFTPYGAPRGTSTTWTDNRGFINAPTDTSTGLTIIGARQYDPATGTFISLDPLFEATSPQQLNGYSYAGDNPITNTDPTGTMIYDDVTGLGYGTVKNLNDDYHKRGWTDNSGHPTKKFNQYITTYNDSWNAYYNSSYYRTQVKANTSTPKPAPVAPTPHDPGHGWWGSSLSNLKSFADRVSAITPELDAIALATLSVPVLGEVTAGIAITADIVSTVDGAVNTVQDVTAKNVDWGKAAFDGVGTLVGAVGLGTASFKGLGVGDLLEERTTAAGAAAERAQKVASSRPWSFKAADQAGAASRRYAGASGTMYGGIAINLGASTVTDTLTMFGNAGYSP